MLFFKRILKSVKTIRKIAFFSHSVDKTSDFRISLREETRNTDARALIDSFYFFSVSFSEIIKR